MINIPSLMSKLICPSCGPENSIKARFCENCGTSVPIEGIEDTTRQRHQNRKQIKSTDRIASLIGLILWILFFDYWCDSTIDWSP